MFSYTTKRIVAVGFILTYFAVGMSNEYIGERVFNSGLEWYPVFSWDLFSFVPNEQHTYHMEILRYGSHEYNPPLAFRYSDDFFKAIGSSPTEYTPLIKKTGSYLKYGDAEGALPFQEKIAGIFGNTPFTYRILYVEYDPVEYWRSGAYTRSEVLATITYP